MVDGPGALHRQHYEMLLESQFWPVARMVEYQRTQLTHLLRHARAQVPFYENRLDAVLRPDGEIDWERWEELPLVTRDHLQTRHAEMQARERPAGHGATFAAQSSGSTGRPIVTTQNALSALTASSATARSYGWHGIDISRTHVCIYGEDPTVGRWPDGLLHEPWGPPVLRGGVAGRQYDLNLATTPEQAVEFIVRQRPAYIGGLVTRVAVVAHEALRQGVKITADAVLPFGEAVLPHHRALYREAFGGARALPLYSSQETYRVAHSCAEHEHYHVNAELMLVEVVGDDGRAVPMGTPGQVVITPFYNTAQPLIRYQIGDIAAAGGTQCSCGRTLPILSNIMGRIAHMFRLPGGRRVLPNISDHDVLALGAQIWQLAQVGPTALEFRYVPGPVAGDEAAFAARVRLQLHPEFEIRFVKLEPGFFQGRRKYIPYVSELPAEA